MWRRLLVRTIIFAILTAGGFACLELLVMLGRDRISDINERFPELMIFFRAATMLTWIEITVLWIRATLQPQVDVQAAAKKALESPTSAAALYATHQLTWLARVGFIFFVMGLGR